MIKSETSEIKTLPASR